MRLCGAPLRVHLHVSVLMFLQGAELLTFRWRRVTAWQKCASYCNRRMIILHQTPCAVAHVQITKRIYLLVLTCQTFNPSRAILQV